MKAIEKITPFLHQYHSGCEICKKKNCSKQEQYKSGLRALQNYIEIRASVALCRLKNLKSSKGTKLYYIPKMGK